MKGPFEEWFVQQYGKLPNPARAEKAKRAIEGAINRISRFGAVVDEEKYLQSAMTHALRGWNAKKYDTEGRLK